MEYPGLDGSGPGPASLWSGCGQPPSGRRAAAGLGPSGLRAGDGPLVLWAWEQGQARPLPGPHCDCRVLSSSEPTRHLLRQLSEKGECEG